MVKETTPPDAPSREVAVIIPAFNSGDHLHQALASLAGQTVQPSVVVVADDDSEDDTIDRARSWQGRLPIEIVRLDRNRGPGVARDRAIRHTTAPFLAMLDADDLFLPDHIETMLAAHSTSPGLISAQELSWYPGTGLSQPKEARRDHPNHDQPNVGELHALLRHNYVNFGFFTRRLYDKAGGFGERYYCEDWDLWIRMLRAGARLTIASHPTAIHRVHPQSLSFDGARIAEHGIDFLTEVLLTARSNAEASAVSAGIKALRGKLSFYRATELAAEGRVRKARQVARAGLPGAGPRATVGLIALALAPLAASRLERMTRRYRLSDGAYAPAAHGDQLGH